MSTPKIPNMKLICDEDLVLVDPILYLYLIRSKMYLVNSRSDLCYVLNTTIVPNHGGVQLFSLERCQSCALIFEGKYSLWRTVHMRH